MRTRNTIPLAVLVVLTSGCGQDLGQDLGRGLGQELACGAGEVPFRGACVDPLRRYEPEAQLDLDNVVAYGEPPEALRLPPPPKSGFRIVAPPRTLAPGEEVSFCLSWPIPEITHRVVHGGRLYTTPGLHHSNMVAKPIEAELGPNPYPDCHPGAEDPFSNIGAGVPDVLFANSTQVVGEETIQFPEGMGYVLDTSREISTSIHFLNTTSAPQRVELAYDFFTMPAAELTEEVAPFVAQIRHFSVPPHTTETVATSCAVFGGHIVSLMPHTHDLAQRFTVDLVSADGEARRVYDDGAFDLESDIQTYDPPLDLEGVSAIRHACLFNNTRDVEVHYGIGLNEMCVLFGYIYPPVKQFAGVVPEDGKPCSSLQLGLFR
ncbi:hypothetical protein [Polyangium spumosum]|uniref:Copper type II ascorbate-dependent monooxygenase C-terminal domain-containing protein n=1 Tax=Polyangium spumosum TaxID=889282 RepID=A0A6N7PNH5_9BACT|nr:hypothetical protein [Polyangium spumosum]MRG91704.1 hypothetical protein [Polyangium spumosum]